jgi:hypothetical protein
VDRAAGHVCYTQEDIRNNLVKALPPSPATVRSHPYLVRAKHLINIERIKTAPVVSGIEFQLVKP